MNLREKIYIGMMAAGMAGLVGSGGALGYMGATEKISQNTARAVELERALETSKSPSYVLNHLEYYQQMENELEGLLKLPEVNEEKAELSSRGDMVSYMIIFGILPCAVTSVAGAFLFAGRRSKRTAALEAEIKKAVEQ